MRHDEHLDTRNPIHAKAYLSAASHILSGWPQDWSAERLAMALIDEDSADQLEVRIWNPVKEIAASEDTDPYFKSDEMICELAESFLDFLEENK